MNNQLFRCLECSVTKSKCFESRSQPGICTVCANKLRDIESEFERLKELLNERPTQSNTGT